MLIFKRHLVAQPLSLSPLTLALARDIAFPRLERKAGEQRLHIRTYITICIICIYICIKAGRFKVGICSGRFGSRSGQVAQGRDLFGSVRFKVGPSRSRSGSVRVGALKVGPPLPPPHPLSCQCELCQD